MNVEREISIFLDRYFYTKAAKEFQRINDLETQLKGIDCTASFPKLGLEKIVIDEKAATHYINKNLPTFAFEINFLDKKGNEHIGWLLDSQKKTNYYLLIWVKAKKKWEVKCSDILQLECMLIERDKIITTIKEKGIEIKKMVEQTGSIRKEKHQSIKMPTNDDKLYFYYTYHLAEKPINLIIRKELLKEISLFHILVTPQKISLAK